MKKQKNGDLLKKLRNRISAFKLGQDDRKLRNQYNNPFKKNKQKELWESYKDGWHNF